MRNKGAWGEQRSGYLAMEWLNNNFDGKMWGLVSFAIDRGHEYFLSKEETGLDFSIKIYGDSGDLRIDTI